MHNDKIYGKMHKEIEQKTNVQMCWLKTVSKLCDSVNE